MTDRIKVPYFDGAEVVLHDGGPDDAPTPQARAAWDAFLALGPEDRLRDSIHLYNYYRDFHEAVGGADWLDDEMGVPAAPAEIWRHVHPLGIALGEDHNAPGTWYVDLEANCDWEVEHGVQMCWQNGATLTKAGGCDGHLTNVNAFADDRLADVVYSAIDPKWTTRRG